MELAFWVQKRAELRTRGVSRVEKGRRKALIQA
jgi:hypothetical protein